jgi:hypothetical protein
MQDKVVALRRCDCRMSVYIAAMLQSELFLLPEQWVNVKRD